MNKLIATLLSFFIYVNSSFAFSNNDVPDEFKVTEHWLSFTTSFDIETKTHRLGTLYRKLLSFVLTYEFYDPLDNKLATARSRFFSLTAHFDVYDHNDNLLGVAEEKIFTFFPTFDIYASDASTKLARAKMNFWGTTFTIYDPRTDQEMATMHRSFLRLKNDWSITITNRPLFMQRNIDPRLLMTVIAFQGDRETWQKEKDQDDRDKNRYKRSIVKLSDQASDVTTYQLGQFLANIDAVSRQEGLNTIKEPDQKSLEAIAKELEENYKKTQATSDSDETSQEQISSFTEYCLNVVQSNDVSDSKKKAILLLLKMRLQSEATR